MHSPLHREHWTVSMPLLLRCSCAGPRPPAQFPRCWSWIQSCPGWCLSGKRRHPRLHCVLQYHIHASAAELQRFFLQCHHDWSMHMQTGHCKRYSGGLLSMLVRHAVAQSPGQLTPWSASHLQARQVMGYSHSCCAYLLYFSACRFTFLAAIAPKLLLG